MDCQTEKGSISLYTISVLGASKKKSTALICKFQNSILYLDLNSFRPDPRDFLEKKKIYKVDITFQKEPLIYLKDHREIPVIKKIVSKDFVLANIR